MNFRKIYGEFPLNYKKKSYNYGNKMLFNLLFNYVKGKKRNILEILLSLLPENSANLRKYFPTTVQTTVRSTSMIEYLHNLAD